MSNQQNKGGRYTNSKNKLTKEAKEILLGLFKEDFKKLDKHINYVSFDERFKEIKPYAKMLCTGNDEVSIKAKELIFESLKPEFKKLKFYFNQLPQHKKAIELRQYLQLLDKEMIEQVFNEIID